MGGNRDGSIASILPYKTKKGKKKFSPKPDFGEGCRREKTVYFYYMNSENVHSIIPLGDFKALYGVDDRDEKLACFALTTATYSIEQYCKRHLVLKTCLDYLDYQGDLVFTLRDYPVREVKEVWVGDALQSPDKYRTLPGCGEDEYLPYYLTLDVETRVWTAKGIKVKYLAGFAQGEAPADLASACFELAAWNFGRYKGKRIGVQGAKHGKGSVDTVESVMPENVRFLLEGYRRKCI
jgi:hypothetical protein